MAGGAVASAVGAAPKRPNVILVMTDDQGYGDFSFTGNPRLKTPTLDKLAGESIRFTNFHVAPACTPTRSQLLTGLHCLRDGASSPHGQRTLAKRGIESMGDVFQANGYRTALYGKWHLGSNFRDIGRMNVAFRTLYTSCAGEFNRIRTIGIVT